MTSCRPQRLSVLIAGHASMAAIFLGGLYWGIVRDGATGGDLAARRAVLEERRPALVLVGNSLLSEGLDDREFSALSGLPTVAACSNGSSSLWWYLYVKNVVAQTQHRPRYVGILFRDTYLTEPDYRVTGALQKPIRQVMTGEEPLVQQLSFGGQSLTDINSPLVWAPREARRWLNLKIEKRTEDLLGQERGQGQAALRDVFAAPNMRAGAYNEFQLAYEELRDPAGYDFNARVEASYLPHLLRLLEERGITPIFLRAKRRRDLDPVAEPPELKAYVAALREYVTQRGALFFDFTHEEQITEAHFGAGDHLTPTAGRQLFMRLLADRLTPALAHHEARRVR